MGMEGEDRKTTKEIFEVYVGRWVISSEKLQNK